MSVQSGGGAMSGIKSVLRNGVAIIASGALLSGCVSIGADKVLHFSASGAISMLATCLADREQAVIVGAGAGFGAGLAKEVYDARPGGSGFSGEDLLADGLGAGVGTAIGYGLCHGQPVSSGAAPGSD